MVAAIALAAARAGYILYQRHVTKIEDAKKQGPPLNPDYYVIPKKLYPYDLKSAQQFLDDIEGRHKIVESEPGLYRHTEIAGDGFKAFELTSLLPKTGFDLHVTKMSD